MPTAPAAIFSPPDAGTPPSAPGGVFVPPGGGGTPAAPGAVFAAVAASGGTVMIVTGILTTDGETPVDLPQWLIPAGSVEGVTVWTDTGDWVSGSSAEFAYGLIPSPSFGDWTLVVPDGVWDWNGIPFPATPDGTFPAAWAPGNLLGTGTPTILASGVSAPAGIFVPPSSGSAPAAPGGVFVPPSSGSAPAAPGGVFVPPSSGSAPAAPGGIFAPPSSGSAPSAPGGIFAPPLDGGPPGAPPPIYGIVDGDIYNSDYQPLLNTDDNKLLNTQR